VTNHSQLGSLIGDFRGKTLCPWKITKGKKANRTSRLSQVQGDLETRRCRKSKKPLKKGRRLPIDTNKGKGEPGTRPTNTSTTKKQPRVRPARDSDKKNQKDIMCSH